MSAIVASSAVPVSAPSAPAPADGPVRASSGGAVSGAAAAVPAMPAGTLPVPPQGSGAPVEAPPEDAAPPREASAETRFFDVLRGAIHGVDASDGGDTAPVKTSHAHRAAVDAGSADDGTARADLGTDPSLAAMQPPPVLPGRAAVPAAAAASAPGEVPLQSVDAATTSRLPNGAEPALPRDAAAQAQAPVALPVAAAAALAARPVQAPTSFVRMPTGKAVAEPIARASQASAAHAAPEASPSAARQLPPAGNNAAEGNPTPVSAAAFGLSTAPSFSQDADATVTLPPGTPAGWRQPLAEALGDRLQLQLGRGIDQAVIRLDPPSLGRIDISIRHEAGNLQVVLSASNSDVLRQLHAVSDTMRQDLVQRQYGDVAVVVSSSAARDGSAAGQGSGQAAAGQGGGGQGGQAGGRERDGRTPGRALAEAETGAAETAFSFVRDRG
jgi:flagellar hook-length control protein FliK